MDIIQFLIGWFGLSIFATLIASRFLKAVNSFQTPPDLDPMKLSEDEIVWLDEQGWSPNIDWTGFVYVNPKKKKRKGVPLPPPPKMNAGQSTIWR